MIRNPFKLLKTAWKSYLFPYTVQQKPINLKKQMASQTSYYILNYGSNQNHREVPGSYARTPS